MLVFRNAPNVWELCDELEKLLNPCSGSGGGFGFRDMDFEFYDYKNAVEGQAVATRFLESRDFVVKDIMLGSTEPLNDEAYTTLFAWAGNNIVKDPKPITLRGRTC